MHVAINAVLFQCLWFATILLGWEYAVLPALLMMAHLSKVKAAYLSNLFLPLFVVLGIGWDSLLISLNLIQISGSPLSLGVMPLWLMMCWLGVALSLGLSLGWWNQYPRLFILSCAFMAPISYYAGMRFGVLSFELYVLGILALGWAGFATLVVYLMPKMIKTAHHPHEQSLNVC